MKTKLSPPFLELYFYFASLAGAAGLARLAGALRAQGATVAGPALIHEGAGISAAPFTARTERPQSQLSLPDWAAVEALLQEPDRRLLGRLIATLAPP